MENKATRLSDDTCPEKEHPVLTEIHLDFPESKEEVLQNYGKAANNVYEANYARIYKEGVEKDLSHEVAHLNASNGARLMTALKFAPNLNEYR